MTYAQLQQRLDRGNVLILDGATGTELQRCGASEAIGPRSADPGSGYIAAPDWRFVDVIDAGALREFQENWLLAGARVTGGYCGTGLAFVRAAVAARDHFLRGWNAIGSFVV